MPNVLDRLEALNEGATEGPWAQQDYWPLSIVPESQKALARGGATDPKLDREGYAQEIAVVQFNETPGEWRKDFPHRRLDLDIAKTDAALIAATRNALPDLLAVARAAQNKNALRGDLDRALAPLLREVEA